MDDIVAQQEFAQRERWSMLADSVICILMLAAAPSLTVRPSQLLGGFSLFAILRGQSRLGSRLLLKLVMADRPPLPAAGSVHRQSRSPAVAGSCPSSLFARYARKTTSARSTFGKIAAENARLDLTEFCCMARETGLVPYVLDLKRLKSLFHSLAARTESRGWIGREQFDAAFSVFSGSIQRRIDMGEDVPASLSSWSAHLCVHSSMALLIGWAIVGRLGGRWPHSCYREPIPKLLRASEVRALQAAAEVSACCVLLMVLVVGRRSVGRRQALSC